MSRLAERAARIEAMLSKLDEVFVVRILGVEKPLVIGGPDAPAVTRRKSRQTREGGPGSKRTRSPRRRPSRQRRQS